MTSTLQIALADDHTIFRKALRELIHSKEGTQVVFDVSDGEALLSNLTKYPCDVLITDLVMPNMNGMQVVSWLREHHHPIKVIVVSVSTDAALINELFEKGIYAYISKAAEIQELWEALDHARNHQVYENRQFKQAVYWQAQQRLLSDDPNRLVKDNPVYRQLLDLLWQEKSTQEIARKLFLSVSSVDKLKQHLKEKTGAKSTVGLIKYALHHNMILSI